MNKFKMRFKLTGLELEIEGNRDQLPGITNGLGNQIGNLLQSSGTIVDAKEPITLTDTPVTTDLIRPRKKAIRSSNGKNGEAAGGEAINFKHDPAKYANPSQEWTAAQKAIWLLFIVEKQAQLTEMSGPALVATFNKHFREAKPIQAGNVVRDLKRQKMKMPAFIVEESAKSPSTWYLTEEGKKHAQQLIATRLNPSIAKAE